MRKKVTVGVTVARPTVTTTAAGELAELERIESRLIEAFAVLKRAGGDDRATFRRAARSGAPDYVHEFSDKVGWETFKDEAPPVGASAADIARMNEALGWLLWLDGTTRVIVSARAARLPWKAVLRRIEGIGRTRAWQLHRDGIARIAAEIRRSNATCPAGRKKF